jgi:hypothetical protein
MEHMYSRIIAQVKTDITTITGALKETLILIPESLALKTDGKERH